MAELFLRWFRAFTFDPSHTRRALVSGRRPAEEIVRGYAVDAINTAAWVPALHRTGALSSALLKDVTDDSTTRRPLLQKARVSFEGQLLDEFRTDGVGDAHALLGDQPPKTDALGPTPQLYWNTWFPHNEGILRNKPHLVVAGTEYRLDTSLGLAPQPGAETNPQDGSELIGKEIVFRLEAKNGEFRLAKDDSPGGEQAEPAEDSDNWRARVVSLPTPCLASGTEPFCVCYRALSAGEATIDAFLVVDGGSVDQQRIVLIAFGADAPDLEATISTEAATPSGRLAGRSVTTAPGADYAVILHGQYADLMHAGNLINQTKKLPSELVSRTNDFARIQYAQLRELSRHSQLTNDPGRPFQLQDADKITLGLAQIGARLHHRLFVSPTPAIADGLPEEMGSIAERLRDADTSTGPRLLQILAEEFALPWGLLYDRSSSGGDDLKRLATWIRTASGDADSTSIETWSRLTGKRSAAPVAG